MLIAGILLVFVLTSLLFMCVFGCLHEAEEQVRAKHRLEALIDAASLDPKNPSLRQQLREGIQSKTWGHMSLEERQAAYELSLRFVRATPNCPETRELALHVGRWHCGKSRPDGNPTIYDEQAIYNDIMVNR